MLTVPSAVGGKPCRLKENEGKSFQGSNVLGLGFTMTPKEAERLIDRNRRNQDVLLPYLNGEDLNSRPDQSARRWVKVSFRDWPLAREGKGKWSGSDDKQRKEWLRSRSGPVCYPDPVAADYPDCLEIVRTKVKPERARLATGDATARDRARRWWQFARPTRELYATIAGLERVLVRTQTSRTQMSAFVPNGQVYGHKLIVFAADEDLFAVLDSSFHYHWVILRGSSMRTDAVYAPSDCFVTFPFPALEEFDQFGAQFLNARVTVLSLAAWA